MEGLQTFGIQEVGLRLHELYQRGYSWDSLDKLLHRFMAAHPQLYPQCHADGNKHTIEMIYQSFSFFLDHGAPEIEHRNKRRGVASEPERKRPSSYRPNAVLPESRLQLAADQSWPRA